MREIGAVTIGKLIEAHYEKDEHKFKAYKENIDMEYALTACMEKNYMRAIGEGDK